MDMISRQAAIEPKAISEWKKEFREYVDSLDITRDDWKGIIEYIDEIPSAQPEPPELITWLLDEIWDDDAWELNYSAFPEILCRKLVKLGYVAVEGEKYVRIDKPTIGN